jgi:lipoprotein-releasing system permease protein
MPFELRVALRYLTARRKQAFISLISGISVLGVTVGVMALMIALGLMTGLQGEIRSRILGATAHISVFRSGALTIEAWREAMDGLRRVPRVLGVAPAVYGKGLLTSSTGSAVATLKGVLPVHERTVTELASQVTAGSLDALGTGGAAGPSRRCCSGRTSRSPSAWAWATSSASRPRRGVSPRWACCHG